MQEIFGSVRRSLVFRPACETHEDSSSSPPLPLLTPTAFVEKINSCIRKSRVFSKPSSPTPPVAPPIRWRKGELIGCGAFGRVYMGMNLDSGELLAVKQVLITANSASKEKAQAHVRELEEEVKLLKNLSHPNIVRYLGTVTEEETLNILLEFVPGGSISSLLGKFGTFPEAVLRMYTKQLLLGLEYLHKNGIMHRDIKGANILVDNKGCIKLADFGASKQVVELATISGAKSMKGTPYWMAPEVILQTGHSFSADIWSVGCTVIEMATGKPPWSQQYQEVAALFYIGTTKSHPPIPEHLSVEAKDFLLNCLRKEPHLRPSASELLKHPFISVEHMDGQSTVPTVRVSTVYLDECSPPLSLQCTQLECPQISTCSNSTDVCNLGSLTSVCTEHHTEVLQVERTKTSENDMYQNDKVNLTHSDVQGSSPSVFNYNKSCNDMCELSNDWESKFGERPEQRSKMQIGNQVNVQFGDPATPAEGENHVPVLSGPISEDEDELTESKIRAFLDEKALELKKLQSPLYEEFYNSFNAACSPSIVEHPCNETTPKYLKLPPKSRSPSQCSVGVQSPGDAVSTGSPQICNKQVTGICSASDQVLQDAPSPQSSEQKGNFVDGQQETISPSMNFSERQRKWKEELDQELERKREMMRQAGVVGKTSSPKDRALNRQRDRTRFASPGK